MFWVVFSEGWSPPFIPLFLVSLQFLSCLLCLCCTFCSRTREECFLLAHWWPRSFVGYSRLCQLDFGNEIHLGRRPFTLRKLQVYIELQTIMEALSLFYTVCNGLCVEFRIKKYCLYAQIVSGLAPLHHRMMSLSALGCRPCLQAMLCWPSGTLSMKETVPDSEKSPPTVENFTILCSSFVPFLWSLTSEQRYRAKPVISFLRGGMKEHVCDRC